MSPLHRAKNLGVTKALIQNGGLVNSADTYGNTPLHCVNYVEVVRLLLSEGANPNARNLKGETPVHLSAYASKVLALVKVGADVDEVDNKGQTLLMKKARCFFISNLLKSILALNPSDRSKDVDGKTAMDFAM
ncbi:unnamed protein product [Pylaiella littoralis]